MLRVHNTDNMKRIPLNTAAWIHCNTNESAKNKIADFYN